MNDFIFVSIGAFYNNLVEHLMQVGLQRAARHFGSKVTLAETAETETAEKEIRVVAQSPNDTLKRPGLPLSSKRGIRRR